MLRGGHGAPSTIGVTCNSLNYWLLTLLPLAVPISVSLWIGYRLRLKYRFKGHENYPFVQGDIHWIKRRVLLFLTVCTIAGVAAGLLGIGSGMIKRIHHARGWRTPSSAIRHGQFYDPLYGFLHNVAVRHQWPDPGEFQFDYMAWFAFVGFSGGFWFEVHWLLCQEVQARVDHGVYAGCDDRVLSAVAMGAIGLKSTWSDIENGLHLGFRGIATVTSLATS